MKRLLTSAQMKKCDGYTIETVGVPSRTLMERAAWSAFDEIMSRQFDTSSVLCLCGTGNNGGDGLALAKMLSDAGVCVSFLLVGDESRATEECGYRLQVLRQAGVRELHGPDMTGVTLAVDAILGIGLTGEVRGAAASAIAALNGAEAAVVSLDIPSGICADTGRVMGQAVRAALTVSFARMKPGHMLYPGREYAGECVVTEIGIGEEAVAEENPTLFVPDEGDVFKMLPTRERNSHKGTFGRVLTVAGNVGMCGAAYLSALGSYRSGAGIVEVYTPEANVPVIQTLLPEAICTAAGDAAHLRQRLKNASAAVLGPGLGTSTAAAGLAEEVIGSTLPLVVDADGLNLCASAEELFRGLARRAAPTVITPHPGEMSRLMRLPAEEVLRDPVSVALRAAEELSVTVVLKGAVTVTAESGVAYLNPTGSSALAKGGSGDVLSGIIGAFMAAGASTADAAVSGVFLHGMAGELAAEELSEYSVLASDTANKVGKAILKCRGKFEK